MGKVDEACNIYRYITLHTYVHSCSSCKTILHVYSCHVEIKSTNIYVYVHIYIRIMYSTSLVQ